MLTYFHFIFKYVFIYVFSGLSLLSLGQVLGIFVSEGVGPESKNIETHGLYFGKCFYYQPFFVDSENIFLLLYSKEWEREM